MEQAEQPEPSAIRAVDLSIVIPVYHEERNVAPLYDRIVAACDPLDKAYEILFIDDGSTDGTFAALADLHRRDRRVRVLRFGRNFGQTAAMAAGFEHARGRVVVTMDGDLQNDPADIPALLAQLDQGYDLVCGWRRDRKDAFWNRRLPSLVANRLIGRITGLRLHDHGCSLKAYRAGVVGVGLYAEMHRFIPALAALSGARIAEVVVRHHERRSGRSKYGLARVWKVLLDLLTVKMIVGFATRPALWFGALAAPFALLATAFLALALLQYARPPQADEFSVVFASVCILLFYAAAHLLSMGFLCEAIFNAGDFDQRELLVRADPGERGAVAARASEGGA
jgi:glycosyltransferase involved in cell wall biosynthesis